MQKADRRIHSRLPFALLAIVALAGRAAAEPSGAWRVAGKVSAFAFTLNCDFMRSGARLDGVCIDASTSNPKIKGGRAHRLTSGSVDGDRVSWTYQSSVLLSKFDVTFDGVQAGDHMSGAITAAGHPGAFTATRR